MIDKIVIKNEQEAQIFFTDRDPITLLSGERDIRKFVMWFLSDSQLTYEDFIKEEDPTII